MRNMMMKMKPRRRIGVNNLCQRTLCSVYIFSSCVNLIPILDFQVKKKKNPIYFKYFISLTENHLSAIEAKIIV